ncbi:hypothetical protein [Actinocorallia herbida]|nr:hypothetical protein [Actinocorallia herbida]
MPRPATGETPRRGPFRIEDSVWKPAVERATGDGLTMTDVVKAHLALYGRELPEGAPEADPWTVINFVVQHTGLQLRPGLDLDAAADACAEFLRALGVRATVDEAGKSS